jgi:hypothetical protein
MENLKDMDKEELTKLQAMTEDMVEKIERQKEQKNNEVVIDELQGKSLNELRELSSEIETEAKRRGKRSGKMWGDPVMELG